jgi:hypothetical protein
MHTQRALQTHRALQLHRTSQLDRASCLRRFVTFIGLLGFATASVLVTTPLTSFASPTPIVAAPEWQEVHHDDLVTVYRKEVEGSDILALKGTGQLDAPMGKILSVVMDAEHRAEWMEQVEEVEVLKQISPTERIVYMHLSPPWPIKDRDVVINEKVVVDKAAHKISLLLKSVEDASRPERDDRVRAIIYQATFELTSADHGKQTAMVAESHADPKGSIPKFIVNLYQKSLPRKTLVRLLDRVHEANIPEHPLAREVASP